MDRTSPARSVGCVVLTRSQLPRHCRPHFLHTVQVPVPPARKVSSKPTSRNVITFFQPFSFNFRQQKQVKGHSLKKQQSINCSVWHYRQAAVPGLRAAQGKPDKQLRTDQKAEVWPHSLPPHPCVQMDLDPLPPATLPNRVTASAPCSFSGGGVGVGVGGVESAFSVVQERVWVRMCSFLV